MAREVSMEEALTIAREAGAPEITKIVPPEPRAPAMEQIRRRFDLSEPVLSLAGPARYKRFGGAGPVKLLSVHSDVQFTVPTIASIATNFWSAVLSFKAFEPVKQFIPERIAPFLEGLGQGEAILDEPVMLSNAIPEVSAIGGRRSWVMQGLDYRRPKAKEGFDIAATPAAPLWHSAIAAIWKLAEEGEDAKIVLRIADHKAIYRTTIIARHLEPEEVMLEDLSEIMTRSEEIPVSQRMFMPRDTVARGTPTAYSPHRLAVLMRYYGIDSITIVGKLVFEEFRIAAYVIDRAFDPIPTDKVMNDPELKDAIMEAKIMFTS